MGIALPALAGGIVFILAGIVLLYRRRKLAATICLILGIILLFGLPLLIITSDM